MTSGAGRSASAREFEMKPGGRVAPGASVAVTLVCVSRRCSRFVRRQPRALPGAFACRFPNSIPQPWVLMVSLRERGRPWRPDRSSPGSELATRGGAERLLVVDIEVLILDAEDHVDQRALVHHEVEAAAGIPAAVARGAVLAGRPPDRRRR